MANKIVNLKDKNDDSLFPVPMMTAADAQLLDVPNITVTDVDPGEGVDLARNHFIAVYDGVAETTMVGAMTIMGTGDDVDIAGGEAVNLNNVTGQFGTGLTHDGRGIRIGAGVSKILVSGTAFLMRDGNIQYDWVWASIGKNGNTVGPRAISSCVVNDYYHSCTIPDWVMNVQEGDLITILSIENCRVRPNSSCLTVKALS